jgi:uncharacterized protein (DUF1499 family)
MLSNVLSLRLFSFSTFNREIAIGALVSALAVPLCNSEIDRAFAFDNAVVKVNSPKTPGSQPKNLGLNGDGKLSICSKPNPNCFSTSVDSELFDEDDKDDHNIPMWKFKGESPDDAFKIIAQTIEQYIPGHDNIDGGGFQIVTYDQKKRYLYVQFESLKRGYIDDVEFAVNDDKTIQVRSCSRLGYLDFTVNAKRLNYISNQLRNLNFVAPEITEKTNPVYFESNITPFKMKT